MSDITHAVSDLVRTVNDLGAALRPATAARYEPPPSLVRLQGEGSAQGVSNPTLDTVLDPRRLALSGEIRATETAVRRATEILAPHAQKLRDATARWEGEESDR